jgi:myo-inositol-1(or 4)-monophosphatase
MTTKWWHETSLAIRAAVEGGQMAKGRNFEMATTKKESIRDVVTAADLAIERHIRGLLAESPYRVVGEELTIESRRELLAKDDPVWVVDPIDGTANYVNGFDYYAISVGLATNNEFLLGAVCLPERTELFSTLGGDRALLNGRIIVHAHRPPSESLIAVSFSGVRGDSLKRQQQFLLFGELNDSSRGCLRLGSAASNLCLTAAGRFQAAYGFDAHIWDVAAGLAVAVRAGCSACITRSDDGLGIDYIVGSRETVSMIRDKSVAIGLLEGSKQQCSKSELVGAAL